MNVLYWNSRGVENIAGSISHGMASVLCKKGKFGEQQGTPAAKMTVATPENLDLERGGGSHTNQRNNVVPETVAAERKKLQVTVEIAVAAAR